MPSVEGIIEAINLCTTWIRSPTGELYIVPNGEVRVVRNFSRRRFSTANIKLKIEGGDLSRALPLLEELGQEAVNRLPNLLEPWQVISFCLETSGAGSHARHPAAWEPPLLGFPDKN